MATAGSNRHIRTGLYDIDLGCPELRKDGVRVPLQEQPFRVLSMLLERPGEVVTREESIPRSVSCGRHLAIRRTIHDSSRRFRDAGIGLSRG